MALINVNSLDETMGTAVEGVVIAYSRGESSEVDLYLTIARHVQMLKTSSTILSNKPCL